MSDVGNFTAALLARRRRRWLQWAVASALVLLLAGLAGVAWFSPVLRLEDVRVTGAKRVSAEEIAAVVIAEYEGVPLPRLPLGAIEEEILDAEPAVQRAELSYAGLRSLSIALTEKIPVAVIEAGSGEFVVDASGSSLGAPLDADREALPHIEIAGGARDDASVAAIIDIVAGLPTALRDQVVSVSAERPDAVELTLDSGVLVRWGGPEDGELKAEVVLMLLEREPETVDVSSPRTPVTS